jgi:hypothetical protein
VRNFIYYAGNKKQKPSRFIGLQMYVEFGKEKPFIGNGDMTLVDVRLVTDSCGTVVMKMSYLLYMPVLTEDL